MPELSRRNFFRRTGGALAAAFILDPERLFWVPGQRTIFVPPVSGWIPLTEEQVDYYWQPSLQRDLCHPFDGNDFKNMQYLGSAFVQEGESAHCVKLTAELYGRGRIVVNNPTAAARV